MHRKNGNAAIDDLGSIFCNDIGDSPAAACINHAQFAGLPNDLIIVEQFSNPLQVFGIGVIGPGLAAGTPVS